MNVYRSQFTQDRDATSFSLLRHSPNLIREKENVQFCRVPDFEEFKRVVFNLNGDSVGATWFYRKILSNMLGYCGSTYSPNGARFFQW